MSEGAWPNHVLPHVITCPECEASGNDAENVAHFWKMRDVRIPPGEHISGGEHMWILGFVCEAHHHWVIELTCHSGGMWVHQRSVPCDGECRECYLEEAGE